MDYFIGGVAALISGDVTPNRPKLIRKAITPIKHQQSPNVTPKSEVVDDRSIFLSPSLQKKKAIVKKSPKRIFQCPDLDITNGSDESSLTSPKADKVKKHLKEELEAEIAPNKSKVNQKSPKKNKKKGKKQLQSNTEQLGITPEKDATEEKLNVSVNVNSTPSKTKRNKKKNKNKSLSNNVTMEPPLEAAKESPAQIIEGSPRKKTMLTEANKVPSDVEKSSSQVSTQKSKKKNRKRKKKSDEKNATENPEVIETEPSESSPKQNKKIFINPNAVADKDSDSEHESDNEIQDENDENNREVLDTGPAESSDDEEEQPTKKKKLNNNSMEKKEEKTMEEEVKRTLFVGNVLFNKKVKKDIKRIFSKYGVIETVRIRTIPVKDARATPKLAVIKNELHPERSTVNVYVKYKDPDSVDKALVENKTVLNDCHIRVTRCDSTGAEHDPRCAVFVGNIPFGLEDDGLRAKFESCGDIHSVRIIRDKKTSAGKGFGYVNFSSKDGVELALALPEEDLTIKNRILRVKRCTQTNKHTQKNYGEKQSLKPGQFQGKPRQFQGNPGHFQGKPGEFQGKPRQGFRGNRGMAGGRGGRSFRGRPGQSGYRGNSEQSVFKGRQNEESDGAFRRIMNKRQNQEAGDGPPNKRAKNMNQPNKEKKGRKEFVGMTAEKKKKNKPNKGQKKKQALSEVLTKQPS